MTFWVPFRSSLGTRPDPKVELGLTCERLGIIWNHFSTDPKVLQNVGSRFAFRPVFRLWSPAGSLTFFIPGVNMSGEFLGPQQPLYIFGAPPGSSKPQVENAVRFGSLSLQS